MGSTDAIPRRPRPITSGATRAAVLARVLAPVLARVLPWAGVLARVGVLARAGVLARVDQALSASPALPLLLSRVQRALAPHGRHRRALLARFLALHGGARVPGDRAPGAAPPAGLGVQAGLPLKGGARLPRRRPR